MTLPRYAARVDKNQQDIVDALREIGCKVEIIGRPVDLLVGFEAKNFLIECKQPGRENDKKDRAQRYWIAEWPGQVRIVTSPQEAIGLVTGAYK